MTYHIWSSIRGLLDYLERILNFFTSSNNSIKILMLIHQYFLKIAFFCIGSNENTEIQLLSLLLLQPKNRIVLHFSYGMVATKKAYGTMTPGPDDRPTEACANSLEFAKKAISFFIPNNHPDGDDNRKQGNPTNSYIVNNVIKWVRKKEV